MLVVAHGNVSEYCENHDMVIVEEYSGKIEDYNGSCPILVTDGLTDVNEYYYLKYILLRRKVELISIHHSEESVLREFVGYMNERQSRNKNGGRMKFGFVRKNGETVINPDMLAVVKRIFELRDSGHTYRQIQNDRGVHHPDGRKVSVSTIQQILKNRGDYDGRE